MNALLTPMLVFLAGGLGCLCRYGIVALGERISEHFPLGTLLANLLGCFAIGVCVPLLFGEDALPTRWRAVLLIGFLGGFTTFSSFAHDTLALAEAGRWLAASTNFLLNNAVGLGLVWLGALGGQALFARVAAGGFG